TAISDPGTPSFPSSSSKGSTAVGRAVAATTECPGRAASTRLTRATPSIASRAPATSAISPEGPKTSTRIISRKPHTRRGREHHPTCSSVSADVDAPRVAPRRHVRSLPFDAGTGAFRWRLRIRDHLESSHNRTYRNPGWTPGPLLFSHLGSLQGAGGNGDPKTATSGGF